MLTANQRTPCVSKVLNFPSIWDKIHPACTNSVSGFILNNTSISLLFDSAHCHFIVANNQPNPAEDPECSKNECSSETLEGRIHGNSITLISL